MDGLRHWKREDSANLNLWKTLVYHNRFNPAAALLTDIFADLMRAEAVSLTGLAARVHQQTCAKVRDDLKLIIGDDEDAVLAEWLDAYRSGDGTLEPLIAQRFEDTLDELLEPPAGD